MTSANENITLNGTDQDDVLVTFGGDDTLLGQGGNDRLNAGAGNDNLLGADPATFGANEQDSLSGGSGSDRFILGDNIHAFYASAGDQDFAIVEDFEAGVDNVTLTGRPDEYSQVIQGNDTYLYCKGFGTKPDELLAIFKNTQGLDLNSSDFTFVLDPNRPPQGFIGNRVFLDENANGIFDGNEGGFGNARVTLTGAGADGVFGTADDVVQEQTTGADGYYGFANLEAGDYQITVDNLPDDAKLTQMNAGSFSELDSDVDPDTGTSDTILLGQDEIRTDIDAGVVAQAVSGLDNNPNDFDILLEAVAAAGLTEALNDPEADITLLAPVDAAFVKLAQDFGYQGNDEAGALNQIIVTLTEVGGGDPLPLLRDILLYHVSPGAKSQSQIENLDVVETLLTGATIRTEGDRLIDNEPDLVDPSFIPNLTNIEVQNGLIQGIDRVLIPLDIPGNGTPPIAPETGFIGNRVFLDENGNGVMDDNEKGIAGARVTLTGAGEDGQFGTGDDINRIQDITSQEGFYGFDQLAAGQYKLSFSNLPEGVAFTQANAGSNDQIDSDVDATTGMTDVIDLAAGEFNATVDAGVIKVAEPTDPKTGFIGNRVFLDENGNGVLDENEGGIAGARVTLTGAGEDGQFGTSDDITRIQDIKNDGGFYGFGDLATGQYKVTFSDLPEGTAFTTQDAGNDEHIDSDANPSTGMTDIIDLAAGQFVANIDAGLVKQAPVDPKTGFIGNRVFLDENGNGVLDENEGGIAGARVTLTGAGEDGQFGTSDDITRIQDIKNDGGFYGFGDLAAGQYKVTFSNLPEGTVFTTQDAGNDEHIDSDANPSTGMTDIINLAAGQFVANIDAGLIKLNRTPDAANDSESTEFNTPVAINVLSNDIDPDGDALSVTSIEGQSVQPGDVITTPNGSVELLDNGQLEFTPNTGFSGNETFSYHVNDGNGGEDTADVLVTVAPKPNAAPDATNDNESTEFNMPVAINVLSNDVDPDGDALSVTSIEGQSVQPGNVITTPNGSVELLDNGQLEFTPNNGFSGNETFSYHVSDGNGGEDTANVSVNVESAPIDYSVELVGDRSIHEGGQGSYFVQLNEMSDRDRTITLDIHNGSAQRRDGDISGQDVNGASFGGYSVGYNANNILYYVYDRVPNGTALSTGDRPQVGPSAQNWDFNVTKDGQINVGNTIQLTIAAGETRSESFQVNAAKEKVTIDHFLTPHGFNDNAIEGTENFSIKIADAGDAAITTGNLNVEINDKTRYAYVSPIAFDLDGNGVQTLSIERGVTFDMFNAGTAVNTGWLSGGDGFLTLDADGNGTIDNRSELFGGSVGEGFAKLASFDSNGDGLVNGADARFGELQVWQDANENGITDQGELQSLASLGISDLKTGYTEVFLPDGQGNIHGEHSSAQRNGAAIDMVDVYFQVR